MTKLAMDGGSPVRTDPFPPRKLFGREEREAVTALFDRAETEGHTVLGYNGPEEEAYCREFAEFLGGGFADGVNSGTNAVYVALRAMEVEPLSEVIVPAITDPGGAMPVALCNCLPVPSDGAPGSYNIGAEQIAQRITDKTRAILVAHIAGIPADMDPILELAKKKNLLVIEDCAQAHGAKYKGKFVGTLGDAAAFSTMFGKHHATGGQGGVVFTKNERMYWRIRRYADRGKPFGLENAGGNVVPSLNCNMDELHAAIGRVQLRKLPGIIQRRRRLAKQLIDGCKMLQTMRILEEPADMEAVYWFLLLQLDRPRLNVDVETLTRALQAEGIAATAGYFHVPMWAPWVKHPHAFAPGLHPREWTLPNIRATDADFIKLPLHEDFTRREVDDILTALKKLESAYRK
ncbi:MAG: DegT/DnrJ/EryC1/StrS family aminotransferase [Phycisphaerae bacterium]|nr:DegT/DnrJ/EryC1/StrS family aminotransferase [Phycisphaerae bacterium]